MPRRNSPLDALQTRKHLLLLEAEIHRAQLRQDWMDFKNSFHHAEEKAKPVLSFLKVAGLVMAGLTALRGLRRSPAQPHAQRSWLKILMGALLPSIVRFISRPRKP